MGTGVGLTIGFIFGSWSIIRCVSTAQPKGLDPYFSDAYLSKAAALVLVVLWQPCLNTCLVAQRPLVFSWLLVQ